MNEIDALSKFLKPLVDYELANGNEIQRIDRPAGTRCPLAIIFRMPLDFDGYEKANGKPECVERWRNRDHHYDLESGYVCKKTNQALAGPTR